MAKTIVVSSNDQDLSGLFRQRGDMRGAKSISAKDFAEAKNLKISQLRVNGKEVPSAWQFFDGESVIVLKEEEKE